MPGLPYSKMPSQQGQEQQLDPTGILNNRFASVHNSFADKEQQLRNATITDVEFDGAMKGLQEDYAKQKSQFDQQAQQLTTLNSLVEQGLINQDAANEASWRMVLPRETAAAMFARPEAGPEAAVEGQPDPGKPFSPSALRSFREDIVEAGIEAEAGAEETGGFLRGVATHMAKSIAPVGMALHERRKKKATGKELKTRLIEQYQLWRDKYGYEAQDPYKRHQMDIQWDDVMREENFNAWDPKDPRVTVSRSRGRLSKAAYNKQFRTPTQVQSAGPMQQQLSRELGRRQQPQPQGRVRVQSPDGKIGSVSQAKLQEALNSGFKRI